MVACRCHCLGVLNRSRYENGASTNGPLPTAVGLKVLLLFLKLPLSLIAIARTINTTFRTSSRNSKFGPAMCCFARIDLDVLVVSGFRCGLCWFADVIGTKTRSRQI